MKHHLFCGGAFRFDRRRDDCLDLIPKDYRSILLGDPARLFADFSDGDTTISPNVDYVGPYFFTTDKLSGEDIILKEKEMIERCTNAIFLFDEAGCPGSVTELMQATMLGKNLHLFLLSAVMTTRSKVFSIPPAGTPSSSANSPTSIPRFTAARIMTMPLKKS